MRKLLAVISVVSITSTTTLAAPYTGPWTMQWDFSNGLQGWTLGQAGGAVGRWVDPAWEPQGPMLPDGGYSGAGGGNLYLPDRTFAKLDISGLNLGYGMGPDGEREGFVFQARVYVPNLRPLTGFNGAGRSQPGNMIHLTGIGIERAGDLKGLFVEGELSSSRCSLKARENAWDNTDRRLGWRAMEGTEADTAQWWDQWVTLQIDYSYTTKGKWSAYAFIPWDSPMAPAGWQALAEDVETNPGGYALVNLRLGGAYSWTQAQFDDVRLAFGPPTVPEPGAIVLMLAAASLTGRRRRS